MWGTSYLSSLLVQRSVRCRGHVGSMRPPLTPGISDEGMWSEGLHCYSIILGIYQMLKPSGLMHTPPSLTPGICKIWVVQVLLPLLPHYPGICWVWGRLYSRLSPPSSTPGICQMWGPSSTMAFSSHWPSDLLVRGLSGIMPSPPPLIPGIGQK